jgi:CRP-like cAMP-binding protein
MKRVVYEAGDTILSEGEYGATAYLLTRGSVEVLIGNGANAKRVATIGAGEVFGEVSLLDPGPRSATVRAMGHVECLVTSYDDFFTAIQEDPEQAVAFMRTLVRRLRHTNDLLVKMDPKRRGLRELLADMQNAASLDGADMARQDWYDFRTV